MFSSYREKCIENDKGSMKDVWLFFHFDLKENFELKHVQTFSE